MTTVKRFIKFSLSLLLVAVPIVAFLHRQDIYDWLRLRNYIPPAAISTLATEDTMTDKARHIFYVNHPKLASDTTSFHLDCPNSEQTIVLGCYQPGQAGIYIYDVQDPRLNGIEEVTAAHEMLHAAYERLSSEDRTYIDGLLQNYFATQTDPRIASTIAAYKVSEPNDVVNEMHSIFGTEIASLPAPLESYYQRYFVSRSAVVASSAKYESEFTSRLTQINNYDAQLKQQKQTIEAEQKALDKQLEKLQTDRQQLDSLRSSGDIAGYNAGIPAFNAEVNAYNAAITTLQKDITNYNDLIEIRNNLAAELKTLDSAIDTRLTTQATQ